jgi:uncharacterized protein YbjT (DUF2867 family)
MSILIIGGTGMVGSELVHSLLARGATFGVMTRQPGEQKQREGVSYIPGDLAEPATLPAAFEGFEKLYLLTPLDPRETELGIAAVRAAADAGVTHIVFQSIHNVDAAPHIPHFRSKIEITNALTRSGIPFTLICPNNFHQNDLWFRDALLEHGVYPQPLGSVGLSRIDVRDIADAAAIALTETGHEGRSYPLVGPDVLTGPAVAEIWARHLGRDVAYPGDDLDAWASQARSVMPDWLVDDLRVMYAHFQEHGLAASADEVQMLEDLLGRPPRSFDAFAKETASAWRS